MSSMDFGDKVMVGGFITIGLLIIAIISSTLSSNSRDMAYESKCTNAGGIYLKSSGQNFCIKEFMPIGGDKE